MSEEKLNTKKWLYNFKVPRKYNKKIEEESKDSEGKPITITREELVTEDVEVYLKRPSRKMFDECNLSKKRVEMEEYFKCEFYKCSTIKFHFYFTIK